MAVIREASMAPLRKQKDLLKISVNNIPPITKEDFFIAL